LRKDGKLWALSIVCENVRGRIEVGALSYFPPSPPLLPSRERGIGQNYLPMTISQNVNSS